MVESRSIPRRRQLRLPAYDYSSAAAYFVTICIHHRLHLLGAIQNGTLEPSEAGRMVDGWWNEVARKFPGVILDESVVMPNHFHAIVGLTEESRDRGITLGRVVGWFKTMTTNEYLRGVRSSGWSPTRRRLWQRGYFEHIVRGDDGLDRIRTYIADNPLAWNADPENPQAPRVGREPWQR